MRVRELGNLGQHDGDDADVLNADPTVVQVVRKGLNVDQGHVVVREGAHISQNRKSLDVLTWFLREGAKISQGRKSLDVLTWFLREGAKISRGTKSLDVVFQRGI